MPVTYARYFPNFDFLFEDYSPSSDFLFFDPVLERFQVPLADRIRTLDPALRRVDAIVIRGGSRGLRIDHIPETLSSILGQTPAYVLRPSTEPVTHPYFERISQTSFHSLPPIEILRAVETMSILRHGSAIHRQPGFHYVGPSGLHTLEFIRIASALTDIVDVARIADWIVPFLSADSLLVGDTGTILPVLLAAQHEAMSRFGWDIGVDALDHYPQESSEIVTLIREAESLGKHIVFVVSVNVSGRLIRLIESLIQPENLSVVCICSCTSLLGSSYVSLSGRPLERWEVDSRGRCEKCDGNRLLPIDPITYEPRPTIEWEPLRVTKSDAAKHQSFWNAVSRTDALQLHYEESHPNGQVRHHGVRFHIGKLLQDQWARRWSIQRLREIGVPGHILIPRHENTELLVELAGAAFDIQNGQLTIIPGDDLPVDLAETMGDETRVLFLDDALVTGRTLLNAKSQFYRLMRKAEKAASIDAFVVVARPGGVSQLAAVQNRYSAPTGDTRFHSAYTLFVPNPGNDRCLLCKESTLLSGWLPRLEGPAAAYAHRRIRAIEHGHSNPTIVTEGDNLRTRGSFFGDLPLGVAFAAAACLAHEKSLSAVYDPSTATVKYVDIPHALARYYDACIVGGILRGAPARTMSYPEYLADTIEALESVDDRDVALVAEVLWAGLANRIPLAALSGLLERIRRRRSPDLIMLRSLISLLSEPSSAVTEP